MRILITGFDPQWGIKKTPSGEVAKLWANGDLQVPGIETHAVVLPQVFGKSAEMGSSPPFGTNQSGGQFPNPNGV